MHQGQFEIRYLSQEHLLDSWDEETNHWRSDWQTSVLPPEGANAGISSLRLLRMSHHTLEMWIQRNWCHVTTNNNHLDSPATSPNDEVCDQMVVYIYLWQRWLHMCDRSFKAEKNTDRFEKHILFYFFKNSPCISQHNDIRLHFVHVTKTSLRKKRVLGWTSMQSWTEQLVESIKTNKKQKMAW